MADHAENFQIVGSVILRVQVPVMYMEQASVRSSPQVNSTFLASPIVKFFLRSSYLCPIGCVSADPLGCRLVPDIFFLFYLGVFFLYRASEKTPEDPDPVQDKVDSQHPKEQEKAQQEQDLHGLSSGDGFVSGFEDVRLAGVQLSMDPPDNPVPRRGSHVPLKGVDLE